MRGADNRRAVIDTFDDGDPARCLFARPRIYFLREVAGIDRKPLDRQVKASDMRVEAIDNGGTLVPYLSPAGSAAGPFENDVVNQPGFFIPAPPDYLNFDS